MSRKPCLSGSFSTRLKPARRHNCTAASFCGLRARASSKRWPPLSYERREEATPRCRQSRAMKTFRKKRTCRDQNREDRSVENIFTKNSKVENIPYLPNWRNVVLVTKSHIRFKYFGVNHYLTRNSSKLTKTLQIWQIITRQVRKRSSMTVWDSWRAPCLSASEVLAGAVCTTPTTFPRMSPAG